MRLPRRHAWAMVAVVLVVVTAAVTYMVVVASPEVLEPGGRSSVHEGIDCHRCHVEGEGVEDELCLDCHSEVEELVWHKEAGGGEDCAECHYEHVDGDYITDLTQVPAHPPRGVDLIGTHVGVRCVECHYAAAVEAECAFCHERFIEGTHEVGFTSQCDLCHIQSIWDVEYDHLLEKAECLECHGEDPDHAYPGYLEYTDNCSLCHAVDVWLLPTYDHEPLGDAQPCVLCHPTSLCPDWGSRSANCSDCHTDTGWLPPSMDHDLFGPTCERCHSDRLPAEHLSEAERAPMGCQDCHEAGTSWARRVDHGNHTSPCVQCHGPQPDLHGRAYADDCGWCHVPEGRDLLKPHPAQEARCVQCHVVEHEGGDPERSVDARHAEACSACHLAGVAWDVQDIDHDALGQGCSDCHAAPHPAIGGWRAACGVCHGTDHWVPVLVDHDRFSEDCLACHVTAHPNGKDQFSQTCTVCHGTDDWTVRTWDHDLANASAIHCSKCHDDIHRGTLGILCEDCHATDTWETEVITP